MKLQGCLQRSRGSCTQILYRCLAYRNVGTAADTVRNIMQASRVITAGGTKCSRNEGATARLEVSKRVRGLTDRPKIASRLAYVPSETLIVD